MSILKSSDFKDTVLTAQPDGKFAIWSYSLDEFVAWDLHSSELWEGALESGAGLPGVKWFIDHRDFHHGPSIGVFDDNEAIATDYMSFLGRWRKK